MTEVSPAVEHSATDRGVTTALVVNCIEVAGLGVAAWLTKSTGLRAQTAVNVAEVAVVVFLLVGVRSSARGPDERHPLGHGRERFFWSLFAALGLFLGGGGVALDQAVQAAVHPEALHEFALAYAVLAATTVLDVYALVIGLGPLRRQRADRHLSSWAYLRRSTDPAMVTVVVAGSCAVIGACLAAGGLAASQALGTATPDTIACGLIGVLLFTASVFLVGVNRDLIGGRGVTPATLSEMRSIVASEPGVIDVPDLFAIVVGTESLIVDGAIIFSSDVDLSVAEQSIIRAEDDLRKRWPKIHYVYLTPVSAQSPGLTRVPSPGSVVNHTRERGKSL
ncbi:MAG TPA: cation transporter [Acidimicrobiales bacterium]|nr:cation transporter [Acidimicrobiales bacterium]